MAVNGDEVAGLEGVVGVRHEEIAAAENGADAHAGGQAEFAQRDGQGGAAGLEADLLQFDAAPGDFLDDEAVGIADRFGQLHGGQPRRTEEVIDAELPREIVEPLLALHGKAGAGDAAACPEGFTDQAAHEIGVVVAGQGEEQVAFGDAGFLEGLNARTAAVQHAAVELFVKFLGEFLVLLDDANGVLLVGEGAGHVQTDGAGANNDDVHVAGVWCGPEGRWGQAKSRCSLCRRGLQGVRRMADWRGADEFSGARLQ